MFLLLLFSLAPSLDFNSAAGQPGSLPEVKHPLIYHPASQATPGTPPYVPADIRKAYDYTPLYSRGIKGNGTRIAIIDAFGDPTLSSDLSTFNSLTSLPSTTVNIYYPDGVPKRGNSGWALETALDVEWAHAIAPSATIDLVVALDASLAHVFDAISFVANSLPTETVLSMSFGLSESSYPTTGSNSIAATHTLFVTITSHGTTPFASSGDSGSASCCNVQYPASDPLVVAVGGTSLTLNSDASYASETTWSGSSAGSSIVFTKPSWQQGHGDSMRDIVDVSYDGDVNTGVLVVQGGSQFQVGGTSAGSPQWAGLLALASQANSLRYGSVTSKLYRATSYHDITSGSNGFFAASTGWDYPTGLGSPDANAIVIALAPSVQVSLNNNAAFQGYNITTTGSLVIDPVSSTFNGTISVTARNIVGGTIAFSKTYVLSSVALIKEPSKLQSRFLLNISLAPYPLSDDLTLTLQGTTAKASSMITRQVDLAGNGYVSVIDFGIVILDFGATLGSQNYNPKADVDADGLISIVDAGVVQLFFGALDFN